MKYLLLVLALLTSTANAAVKVNMPEYSGYTNGITAACTTSSASFADPSACTNIALTQITNKSMGTVTTASGSLPGITLTFPLAGTYEVYARTQIATTGNGNNMSARLVDGSSTVIDPGTTVYDTGSGATGTFNINLHGMYVATATATTLKVQLAIAAGSTYIPPAVIAGTAQVQWVVKFIHP